MQIYSLLTLINHYEPLLTLSLCCFLVQGGPMEIKWLDGHKPLFKITTRLDSTIYAQVGMATHGVKGLLPWPVVCPLPPLPLVYGVPSPWSMVSSPSPPLGLWCPLSPLPLVYGVPSLPSSWSMVSPPSPPLGLWCPLPPLPLVYGVPSLPSPWSMVSPPSPPLGLWCRLPSLPLVYGVPSP